jgi:hypothetical protein
MILLGARHFSLIENIQAIYGISHPPIQWVPDLFCWGKAAGA